MSDTVKKVTMKQLRNKGIADQHGIDGRKYREFVKAMALRGFAVKIIF
ncbi:hypothetical protein [Macrococcus carouselicus]|nr:hypothetical protein [Macrococcus carouselicus]